MIQIQPSSPTSIHPAAAARAIDTNVWDQGPAVIQVVDPDAAVRQLVQRAVAAVGVIARGHSSLGELLKAAPLSQPGCLLIDSSVPLLSLLELRTQLWSNGIQQPILVMTARVDVASAVRAMKSGVTDMLEKPLHEQPILDAVREALTLDAARRHAAGRVAQLRARFSTLSHRERQVLTLVAAGRLNKQVAFDLELSEITVKVHRANAMRKMGARTLVDLVRMADAIAGRNGQCQDEVLPHSQEMAIAAARS